MDEFKKTGKVSSNTPEGELLQWERNIHEENLKTVDYGKPVPRLDLDEFKGELLDQAHALNQDFLQ